MNNAMENPVIQAIKRLSLGRSPQQDYTTNPTPGQPPQNYTSLPTPGNPPQSYTHLPTPGAPPNGPGNLTGDPPVGFEELLRRLFGMTAGGPTPVGGGNGQWQPQQAYTSSPTPAGTTSAPGQPQQDYTHLPTPTAPLQGGWAGGSGGGGDYRPTQPFDGVIRQPLGPVSESPTTGNTGKGGPLTGTPVPNDSNSPYAPMRGTSR